MKKTALFCLLITLWYSGSHAQISIDTITTETVNIFDKRGIETTAASSAALWATVLLPGTGHQIVSRPKSALAYISIDILSLCGAVALHHYAQKTTQNALALAYVHAGIQNRSPSEYYWQIIGNFDSYEDYHKAYPTDFREFSDKFITEADYWKWDQKEDARKEFNNLRKDSKRMSTLSTFFIGAMFLNRLVAFIELRSSLKNQRYTTTSTISFTPVSNHNGDGLVLSTTF